MKKNKFFMFLYLFIGILFIIIVFYYRTGYFESSTRNNMTTFYTTKDTIKTNIYYRDLSGNWILLEKGKVIKDNDIKMITIHND